MEHFATCDARNLAAITRAIAQAALGHRVSFWIDQGVTRRMEAGKPIDIPNGTLSIHLYINGGAVDQIVAERQPEPTPQPQPQPVGPTP